MMTLLMALSGAAVVAGILGVIVAARPVPERPPRPRRQARFLADWRRLPLARRWSVLVAALIGVLVGVVTGWLLLAVLLPAAVLGLPVLLASSTQNERIARLDGIAEWTRNLSGVLIGGQGLEQAILASLRSTPESIQPQSRRAAPRPVDHRGGTPRFRRRPRRRDR